MVRSRRFFGAVSRPSLTHFVVRARRSFFFSSALSSFGDFFTNRRPCSPLALSLSRLSCGPVLPSRAVELSGEKTCHICRVARRLPHPEGKRQLSRRMHARTHLRWCFRRGTVSGRQAEKEKRGGRARFRSSMQRASGWWRAVLSFLRGRARRRRQHSRRPLSLPLLLCVNGSSPFGTARCALRSCAAYLCRPPLLSLPAILMLLPRHAFSPLFLSVFTCSLVPRRRKPNQNGLHIFYAPSTVYPALSSLLPSL